MRTQPLLTMLTKTSVAPLSEARTAIKPSEAGSTRSVSDSLFVMVLLAPSSCSCLSHRLLCDLAVNVDGPVPYNVVV
jgi:hypothetical protein